MMWRNSCHRGLAAILAVTVVAVVLCVGVARGQSAFRDSFADLQGVSESSGVALLRDFPRIPQEPDVRIDSSGVAYFPTIVALQNGELLCAFHEPQHAVDRENGRDMVCYSTDGGRTWSEEILAVDVPGIDDRDPILCQTPDGRVWLGAAGGRIVYSDDNGRTWSEPIQGGIYPVGVMDNGEFLWTRGGRGTGYFRGVTDGVAQFQDFAQPNLRRNSTDEWYIAIGKKAGRLVTMMREQNMGEYYYTATSDDYGQTFEPAHPSSVWHTPSQSRALLMTMDDGTIVCTYGERQNNRVMAVASFDDGQTWDIHHKLVICDNYELMHGDFAYPHACQIAGSELMAVWYANGKVYGNRLDARYFRDAYHGVRLADSAPPVTENCVAYWSFDEAEGPIAHDAARYNYGKISGAQRVPGKLGQALHFDGLNDYVLVIDTDTLRVPRYYRLQAWIRTEDPLREQTILDKGLPYYLGISEGKLVYRTGTITFRGNQVLEAGRWYHIAVVVWPQREYSRMSFYINGQRDGDVHSISSRAGDSYLGALVRNDMRLTVGPQYQEYYPPSDQRIEALTIGISQDKVSYPFAGDIDEVAIYAGPTSDYMDYSLSATEQEIRDNYQRQFTQIGTVVSGNITKPATGKWGVFAAQTSEPPGTDINFTIVDSSGAVLRSQVEPGADLSRLEVSTIRLVARLATADPTQTPILYGWRIE